MTKVTTVGIDLAKRVFQVHGGDAWGRAAFSRRLTRGQVLKFTTLPRRDGGVRRRA